MWNILPDKLMPELDDMLADRVERKNSTTLDFDAQLTAHYATRAILSRVKAVYVGFKDGLDCTIADNFVSYFLRVDTDFGLRQLRGRDLSCMGHSVEMAVRMKRWNALEPSLIAQLNDPDPWKARSAADLLARFGGRAAKQAMLERLRRFHQQWVKREAEFRWTPGTPKDVSDASSFQYGLEAALGTAQGWILNDTEIDEIQQLAVGSAKENVASWRAPSSEGAIAINIVDLDDLNVTIGRYLVRNVGTLRAKLAQFPSGTTFLLQVLPLYEEKKADAVVQVIHETAQEHGFNIQTAKNQ